MSIAETVPLLAPLEAFGICLRFHERLRSQPAAYRQVISEEFSGHMCHFFDFFLPEHSAQHALNALIFLTSEFFFDILEFKLNNSSQSEEFGRGLLATGTGVRFAIKARLHSTVVFCSEAALTATALKLRYRSNDQARAHYHQLKTGRMFIPSEIPLPVQTRLRLTLILPEESQSIAFQAEVL
ncbi:MAG: hypothetical protein ACM3KE_06015, partial [Hyphomicrobiales bacterium]